MYIDKRHRLPRPNHIFYLSLVFQYPEELKEIVDKKETFLPDEHVYEVEGSSNSLACPLRRKSKEL